MIVRWAGGVIRGDVDNIGGSRHWLITVMVQSTSLRLVVPICWRHARHCMLAVQ